MRDVSNGIKRVLFGVDLRSVPIGTLTCPHGLSVSLAAHCGSAYTKYI